MREKKKATTIPPYSKHNAFCLTILLMMENESRLNKFKHKPHPLSTTCSNTPTKVHTHIYTHSIFFVWMANYVFLFVSSFRSNISRQCVHANRLRTQSLQAVWLNHFLIQLKQFVLIFTFYWTFLSRNLRRTIERMWFCFSILYSTP